MFPWSKKLPQDSQIPKWVQDEIDRVRKENLSILDLSKPPEWIGSGHRLRYIPESILEMRHLRTLNLDTHKIAEIPSELGQLTNLRELTIHGNYNSIPESLSQLEMLSKLKLTGSSATFKLTPIVAAVSTGAYIQIPPWLGNLKHLQRLILCGNFSAVPLTINTLSKLQYLKLIGPISRLPTELGKLSELVGLTIIGLMRQIPASIGDLRKLNKLDLLGQFKSLPENIKQLKQLKFLTIWAELSKVPDCIYSLPNLRQLNLSYNKIDTVPAEILRLPKLEELNVDANPISMPPKEIIGNLKYANLNAIHDYYRGLANDEEDYLYEAKLLVVGEGGAGKTTLCRKVLDANYELMDDQTTKGIDIQRWDFSVPDQPQRNFRVNLWDFGGQEIYHSTHQFFLTRRSVYALVADDRKEDTDFYYWLNVIEILGGSSPVIIVKNERQGRSHQIDELQLKARFPNIAGVLATDFSINRGLDTLVKEIKWRMLNLSHVGTVLPRSWVQVRQVLEDDTRHYVRLDEYYHLCHMNSIIDHSTQNTVLEYLHDLGVCLHFKDDPLLRDWVILKPEWGTNAVYKVLDNEQVGKSGGQFTQMALKSIWNDAAYDGMHDQLLRLMMRFKLCYEIPLSPGFFLAPQLLSINKPSYRWNKDQNRYFRFTYEFMPKGLVTRLIVALNKLIQEPNVWKTGVVFQREGTIAEVIEDYPEKQIRIRLRGANIRGLLAIIKYAMEEIHQSYRNLKVDSMVPCNCLKCNDLTQPHFYKETILQEAQKLFKEVQCQKSFSMVDPSQLLDTLPTSREGAIASGVSTSIRVKSPFDNIIIVGEGGTYMDSKQVDITTGDIQAGNVNLGNQDIGDNANISFNLQPLQEAPEGSALADLKTLMKELEAALHELSPNQAEYTQLVHEYAQEAVVEASKEKPNKLRLEITGESLKKAAENLLTVAPIAAQIAQKLLMIG